MSQPARRNAPGRRAYDESAAEVVPLRVHLEDKITSSHNALAASILELRADLAEDRAASRAEHVLVRNELRGLAEIVTTLRTQWRALVALVAFLGLVAGIATNVAHLI